MLQLFAANGGVAEFQLEHRDHRTQVGIATALAVAVGRPLNVCRAQLDCRDGVGDGQLGVVVGVDADDAVEPLANLGEYLAEPVRDRAAIGVTEYENVGACFLGGFEGAQREVGARFVAVEEVLGVEDDFPALLFDVPDGLGDHGQVLLFGHAKGALGVQTPALAKDRDDGGFSFQERVDVGVRMHSVARVARRAEGGQAGVLELQVAGAREEVLVAGVRTRPAALDVVDPELVEFLGDHQLVVDREGDVFSLGAVTQRGVVGEDSHGIASDRVFGAAEVPR